MKKTEKVKALSCFGNYSLRFFLHLLYNTLEEQKNREIDIIFWTIKSSKNGHEETKRDL